MRKINSKFYKFFAAAIFASVIIASPACARVIRVGLATGVASASVSGRGLTVQDASRHRASSPSGFTAQARGNVVVINGKNFSSPVTVSSSAPLTFAKSNYEGEILLIASGGRLTVVNRLDMEKYLRGVVSTEISPKWAHEVLKAQAIISRTFANVQMGRHNSAGFDVCSSDHCQVYKGMSVYSDTTDRAISQTRDRVLTYKGQLAQTYFCSDSGGATANIADVWGKPIPYLTVRREPFPSASPNATWQATLSASEIQSALAKKGKGVGNLRGISISQRDAAGRAIALTFEGSAGKTTMTSSNFRTLVGGTKLRSTFFDFSPSSGASVKNVEPEPTPAPTPKKTPQPPTHAPRKKSSKKLNDNSPLSPEEKENLQILFEQRRFPVNQRLELIGDPARARAVLRRYGFAEGDEEPVQQYEPAPQPAPAPRKTTHSSAPARGASSANLSRGSVTFYGRGWGHGVGMSQWGAKAMADHGWSVEKILEFYYPGTSIQKR